MTQLQFSHKTFEIFRQWGKNTLIHFSNFEIEIVDEILLVNDLEECFENAIVALQRNKDEIKRKQMGYDYAYITSYVRSSLNVKWMYEYIEKQTEPYKMYMANKAMEQYFKLDTQTVERITKLYYHLFYNDTNLLNGDENVQHKAIISEEVEAINFAKDNPILQMINNNISNYLSQYLKEDKPDCVPDIRTYFTYSEITNYFTNYKPL